MQYRVYKMTGREIVISILKGISIIAVVSYLFYYSWISFWCMTPFLFFYVRSEKKRLLRKRYGQLKREFKEGIQALHAALEAGYSLENAFVEALKDLALLYPRETYITREFKRIIQGIRMNTPAEKLLNDFGERSNIDDIRNFAEIFAIAKRSGGDMTLIIQSTVTTIREKIQVENEVQTMMSGKKLEQKVMNVIPFGILAYVKLTSDGFLDIMYETEVGVIVMSVCLLVYIISIWIANRIISVEV